MIFSSLSITGRRNANEDSFIFSDNKENMFGIVADGMGGHKGGAVASALAVKTIESYLMREGLLSFKKRLETAIHTANDVIFDRASSSADVHNMGTTVVCAIVTDEMVSYSHVGDSRIYLMHDRKLKRLTEDHSYVWSLVKDGILDEEGARVHKMRNIITRAVGLHETVEVASDEIAWSEGDILLMCTDGLHDEMPASQIEQVLQLDEPLNVIAKRLVDTAYGNGSGDNITVLLIKNTAEAQ
ncbi:MAG: Stp1/IreP family PP2C-type Ser/Thr phosphatase [Clostridia bacterium]|nr:Stp1/IreP family PP2C-type Ser/Thr phosphatase [Clostridia bacterium]